MKILISFLLFFSSIFYLFAKEPDWVVFNIDSLTNIQGNIAYKLLTDKHDNKWFITKNAVYSIKETNFTGYKLPDNFFSKLYSFQILRFDIEDSAKIWLLYYYIDANFKKGYNLIRFDNNDSRKVNIPDFNFDNERIYDLKIDQDNKIWLATSKGLVTLKDSIWTFYDRQTSEIPSDTVYKIELDSKGCKWLSTAKGIIKYDDDHWLPIFNIIPRFFKIDYLDNLWYTNEATGYLSVRMFNGFNWADYWIFSWSGGYNYLFSSLEIDQSNNVWFSIYEENHSSLGSLLSLTYNGSSWKKDEHNNSGLFPLSTLVHSIKSDAKNNIWIAADNNLWVFNNDGVKLPADEILNRSIGFYASLFPNPVNDRLFLAYLLPENSSISIELYNISGKKITAVFSGHQDKGMHSLEYNLSHLPDGIYFICLKNEKENIVLKVIKG